MSDLTEKIERQIEHLVNGHGCVIVRIAIIGDFRSKTIQIMIERENGDSVTIGDCEAVSKEASVAIEVLNLFKGHYNLEVSSTGISRPLVKPVDFERFSGKYVVIKVHEPIGDKKLIKGMLDSSTENGIKLYLSDLGETIDIRYSDIKFAHIDGEKYISF